MSITVNANSFSQKMTLPSIKFIIRSEFFIKLVIKYSVMSKFFHIYQLKWLFEKYFKCTWTLETPETRINDFKVPQKYLFHIPMKKIGIIFVQKTIN